VEVISPMLFTLPLLFNIIPFFSTFLLCSINVFHSCSSFSFARASILCFTIVLHFLWQEQQHCLPNLQPWVSHSIPQGPSLEIKSSVHLLFLFFFQFVPRLGQITHFLFFELGFLRKLGLMFWFGGRVKVVACGVWFIEWLWNWLLCCGLWMGIMLVGFYE